MRGLAPGGVFVLEAHSVAQRRHGTGGPRTLELPLTFDALRKAVPGLDKLHAEEEIEREVREGALHGGLPPRVGYLR